MDEFQPEQRGPEKEGQGQEARLSESTKWRKGSSVGKEERGGGGSQKGSAIRSVLGLHIYTVEGVHRWALN